MEPVLTTLTLAPAAIIIPKPVFIPVIRALQGGAYMLLPADPPKTRRVPALARETRTHPHRGYSALPKVRKKERDPKDTQTRILLLIRGV